MPGTERLPVWGRGKTVVAWTLIDADVAPYVRGRRWSLNSHGYVVRGTTSGGRRIKFRLARVVMGLTDEDKRCVDHINRNPLDNRRENLRIVTKAQNNQNVSARGGSSQYRGVSWNKGVRKWQANVQLGGVNHYLGVFVDEDEAARVAADFRREHMPFTVEERPVLAA